MSTKNVLSREDIEWLMNESITASQQKLNRQLIDLSKSLSAAEFQRNRQREIMQKAAERVAEEQEKIDVYQQMIDAIERGVQERGA